MTYSSKHLFIALAAAFLFAAPSLFADTQPADASLPAASPSPGTRLPAPVPANADDHILMAGDLIDVKVFQEPDLESNLRIARDGSVVFPLIGRVNVGGMAPQAAARIIQDLLNKDYLVNPHVSLLVIEYARRTFTVLGEVQKPGAYEMPDRADISLLEAIGMSGGYTRMANPGSVTVKRRVNAQETIYHLNAKKMASASGSTASFAIQPGDVITVSESIF